VSRRAIVIGGSLGGLLAANMLHSIGWQVDVYERTGDDLASRGAGIGTHEELFEIFDRMRIAVDTASIGVVPLSRTCLDSAGKPVASIRSPRVLSSWAKLYRALKEAFPDSAYHFGKALSHFEDGTDGVLAHFTDSTRAEADLLIGADGLRSTVRQQLFSRVHPRYAGYVAWRGMVPEADIPETLHRETFEHQILCMPEGQNIVAYPVPGLDNDIRPGHRAYNIVWYSPVDEAGLKDLCTDANGHYYENGIPPDLIRPELIASMRALARKVLAPQFAVLLEATPKIFFQPIYDLESPKMALGRVALLGDAAFVARPHCAMGVTKAALDAESLADALAAAGDDIAAGLARYDREQGEFGRRCVARARYLGAHLEAQHKPRELRTAAELSRDPEKWIRESGARLRDIPELLELVQARKLLPSSSRRPLERAAPRGQ
jgi:2-polyprenyl-6-methoxyphenol hydroxylase-like FAD-dependent oxidoreductase